VPLAENESAQDLDQDGNPIPGAPTKPTDDNLLKQSIDLVTGKTTTAQLIGDTDGPIRGADEAHPITQKGAAAKVPPEK